MNRLVRRGILLVALLLPVGAATWPRPPAPVPVAPGLPDLRFSVDAAALVTPEEAAAIKHAGAQQVRLILSWAQVEPRAPKGPTHTYDWREPDSVLGILADQQLDVLLTIRDNPQWAAAQPNGLVDSADQASYYDFVRAAVGRYGAASYTVRVWEVYNEEDAATNFGRRPAEYVDVLRQDYAIIKAQAPAAAVVMGGMGYDNFVDQKGFFVRSFLADLLAAGAAPYTDAINFHSYSNSTWGTLAATVASLRATLAHAGVQKPLIWTEGGKSSSPALRGSPAAQAAYVAQVYAAAQGQGVRQMTWFPFQDFTTDIPGFTFFIHHGLTGPDGTPKPAYTAYRVAAGYLTATTPLRVQAASEFGGAPGEGYTFQRPDGTGLVVAWADAAAAVQETWPAAHVAAVRDVYGQRVAYTTDHGQATIPLTGSPVYIELDTPARFADVPLDFWGQPFVERLAAQGVLAGYDDSTFRPAANTTRGQISKVLVAALGWPLTHPATAHFRDVPPGNPFYPYVETARAHGVVGGYGDGTFRPQAAVTRAQVSQMIALAWDWPPVNASTGPHDFGDVLPRQVFYGLIEAAYSRGVVGGYDDGTFRPAAPVTRAQLAKMIALALDAGR